MTSRIWAGVLLVACIGLSGCVDDSGYDGSSDGRRLSRDYDGPRSDGRDRRRDDEQRYEEPERRRDDDVRRRGRDDDSGMENEDRRGRDDVDASPDDETPSQRALRKKRRLLSMPEYNEEDRGSAY